MLKNEIKILKTARFFVIGEYTQKISEILFVIHGYGQLASSFIEKFGKFSGDKRIVVAPEGLSRFYLKGFDGTVGASWMTKEERESEIIDYVGYLNKVYDTVISKFPDNVPKVRILGFSQGCATAFRWICDRHVIPSDVILWAGSIPDFDRETGRFFSSLNLKLVFGSRDAFFGKAKIDEYTNMLNRRELDFQIIEFDGGHELDSKTLEKILD